ncbi:hypothetical protein Bca4012_089432 [Brassica carinata]|uniref:Uncharacterized protein n=1 Tax=Brassica carinata TaxID=52824 RepID=A0A8X7PCW4_BRACI|nr:hypothetical protein Bca52824_087047 [Brassica carinata]
MENCLGYLSFKAVLSSSSLCRKGMRVTKAIRFPNCFFARSQEFDLFTSPSFYGTKEEGKLTVDSLFIFSFNSSA